MNAVATVEVSTGNGVTIRSDHVEIGNLRGARRPGGPDRRARRREGRTMAQITEPKVVRKILEHLGLPTDEVELAPARGPPEWDDAEAEPPWPDDDWL